MNYLFTISFLRKNSSLRLKYLHYLFFNYRERMNKKQLFDRVWSFPLQFLPKDLPQQTQFSHFE